MITGIFLNEPLTGEQGRLLNALDVLDWRIVKLEKLHHIVNGTDPDKAPGIPTLPHVGHQSPVWEQPCSCPPSAQGAVNTVRSRHAVRHYQLHKALDELVADYILHVPGATLSKTSVADLMAWSSRQQTEPDEVEVAR